MKTINHSGKRITLNFDDKIIADEMGHKFYEHWLLDFIKDNVKGGTWIDGGANFGNHTVFFDKFCDNEKVIAIEPVELNYNFLHENVRRNKCDKTTLFKGGLSNKHIKATSKKGGAGRNSQFIMVEGRGPIQLTTIDRMQLRDVKLIKLDIEGGELRALMGARETLEKYKPELFIEIWENKAAFDKYLAQFGYEAKQRYCHAPVYHYSVNDYPKHI